MKSRMSPKTASTILLIGMLSSVIVFSFSLAVYSQFEEWVPYVPSPSQVELAFRKEGGMSYVDVTIEFSRTGYNVSDWGAPTFYANNISVNAEMWRWTGPALPIDFTISYTYNLGSLEPGQYLFTFRVWLFPVKNITFGAQIVVPDDYPTIQEAVNNANEGDRIFVRNGTYYEHVTIDKSISLVGDNRNASIVDGSQNGTVISIIADYVSVSNLTIRNGYYVPHINYGIKIGEWNHGCKNVSVSENIVSANDIGVLVYCSNNVAVLNNTFFGNYIGLEIVLSSENYVEGNNLVNNWMGIGIGSDANSNVVIDNEISNSDFGVQVGWSTDNKIVGNTISLSTSSGIRFDASHNNSITGNTITSCNREGIVLFGSNSNIITMNKLVQNNWDGIAVWYSNANLICHNNFETNAKHAGSYAGSINTWDDGYPSGGNYWSNYIGTDADNDGIGDLPYVIDADNRDRYPLMKPFGTPIKGDVDSNGMVDINDVIVWTNAFGSQPQDPDWNPYTDLHADGVIDIFDAVVIATNFGRTHA